MVNDEDFLAFVREHKDEDTARLLLSAARYPAIDMAAAVRQIEGMRTAREKWPGLLECEEFLYPPLLNREQSSSEATARYKVAVASTLFAGKKHITMTDLTGGMGIDTLWMARMLAETVDYVERDEMLCRLMTHNIKATGAENIAVHCDDSMDWLKNSTQHYDLLFIDPARRDVAGRKVAAFEDCTPNILENHSLLMSHCDWLMVKASPMTDINSGVRQLGNVADVHVVAVGGECKELLFVCGKEASEPTIHCVNIKKREQKHKTETFSFTRSMEAGASVRYCTAVGHYLYEPDATIMKAGSFKLASQRFGIDKLDRNTHLYTSDKVVDGFPGRVFEVLKELSLNRKSVAAALPGGKAHVVTRNYPVAAAALQKQLGLNEGGELFVVATTVLGKRKGFLCCIHKALTPRFDQKSF